ncbi:amino acid permease, partial [Bacillus haikouensis]|nr:amino acid permease [Bacillus haikouensis]
SALILDAIVLAAFIWVKAQSDLLVVGVSLAFMILIFTGEHFFLKNRDSEEENSDTSHEH